MSLTHRQNNPDMRVRTPPAADPHPFRRTSYHDSEDSAAKDNVELQYLPVSHHPAYKLRRFPFRALVLIIIPPVILAYFVVLKTNLLSSDPEIIPYSHRNARWVFYLWFFIGVFGLSVSNHAEKTWTGLNRWWVLFKGTVKTKGKKALVGRLWMLFAVLSLALYIALPLSGLTMELYDGYVKSSGHPKVLGRTFDNFNARYYGMQGKAEDSWRNNAPMILPGFGILYISPDTDRGEVEALKTLPNSLLHSGGLMNMFLAPQAVAPVEGRAWGLRLGYKCDVVTSISNFTLLNKRWSTGQLAPPTNSNSISASYNETTITFWNGKVPRSTTNTWAYGETAETRTKPNSAGERVWSNASTFDEEGLKSAGNVLEIALWQLRREVTYKRELGEYSFNETVQPSIAGLGSPFFYDPRSANNFSLNNSFFPDQLMSNGLNLSAIADATNTNWSASISQDQPLLSIAQPIGLRCLHQADRAYANLHPESATFTSFTPTGARPASANAEQEFGARAIEIVRQTYYDMYTPTAMGAVSNTWFYTKFIDLEALMKAVMHAYAMDALHLMYNGGTDFVDAYKHENLTSTKEGKILGLGEVPTEVPLVLFAIWAAGCMTIGVVYGFKPRWAETLNGFTMFCLGGDFAKEIRSSDVVIHKDYADSEGLSRIRGMIGNASTTSVVGRLSLVERRKGNVANRTKLYR
ncbi:hypothetical protein AJ80_07159 [Polytolypa hystricis UAMH7299]|uniref:Uncharacterized protein n=1 Tax=Polytolypa hystricis (strain UAMH7299) TaxID=1447883 RepID=A0A2B7XS00_POLH7|nr:hypothetical protein AJ80_07159 [Polytolypa hystricis UAMH7299]